MIDKYSSYAELARFERLGIDYRTESLARTGSAVIVIAPHGGGIEVGTSELTRLIAGVEHSFFVFEGLKGYGENRALHITSRRFDHPECVSLVGAHEVVLGVHGCRGESQIFVGGLDVELRALLAERLLAAGFPTRATDHGYLGESPENICNRGRRGRGAQLEVTKDLRDAPHRERIAIVVREVLTEHIAGDITSA